MIRGRLLFLTGLDGCGKTTQAQLLLDHLRRTDGNWVYRWARWKPLLTLPLMMVARWVLQKGKTASRPTDDSGHTRFVSDKRRVFGSRWLRDLWSSLVLLEYLPQAWWRLLPPLWRGQNVICDRYLPDVWIDLAMNFGEGVEGVARLRRHPLCRLFPKPRQTVLLDVDPRIGFARKQDGTPLAYLSDRRPLYRSLPALLDADVVDANAPAEDVARELLDALGAEVDPEGRRA